MVYLDNKKDPQEVWIPRNDGNGSTHSGSSHSYEEGYADGVNDQKAKLASTAFTENGDYQRNDGWSAITVNVPQSGSVMEGKEITVSQDVTIVIPTSGYDGFSAVTVDATEYGQTNYDSGFDDGFTDGYSSGSSEGYDSGYTDGYQSGSTDGYNSGFTSGETHQKSLLGTTAFTINGSYSAENGYSAITVNVPTGQTYNIEQNKPFTATSNGNYTIKPSEIWSITYDNTFARRYDFTINGTIPQSFVNDTAYVVRYYDEITEEEPIVIIKVGSGNTLYLNKNGWDEDDYGDVYFRLYQGKYRLEFDNDDLDSSEFSIIPYSNGEKYDVMSAVTLNVNVPSSSGGSEDFAKMIDRSITEVVIPSGVTKIGDYSFASCNNLKSITIPNSVTSIGIYCFANCYALSSVTIPSGVTLLGGSCFYNNYALSSIIIPNSVTYLGTNIFYACIALTSITFSNSSTIPSSCCYNCSALTEVNIGSGVTKIDAQAFRNCVALTNIYISATTAPTISNASAFQNVPSTGTVHYPQGSDYSSWQSNTYLSGWTFVADL